MKNNLLITCDECSSGELVEVAYTHPRKFRPHGKILTIELVKSVCNSCGAECVLPSQHERNMQSMRGRKKHYGNVLMGEELVAFRHRYGITQVDAIKLFGLKGKVTFSRYENETSYPDGPINSLICAAIEIPQMAKFLADRNGVELPLWSPSAKEVPAPQVAYAHAPLTSGHLVTNQSTDPLLASHRVPRKTNYLRVDLHDRNEPAPMTYGFALTVNAIAAAGNRVFEGIKILTGNNSPSVRC